MIIEFDSATLVPFHFVFDADPLFLEHLKATSSAWISHEETLRPEEVEILPGPAVRRRVAMSIVCPLACAAGDEVTIAGVPEGVSITINSDAFGTMDGSGALEFTAENAGSYRFRFEGSGWITTEVSLEAHP